MSFKKKKLGPNAGTTLNTILKSLTFRLWAVGLEAVEWLNQSCVLSSCA